MAAAKVVIRLYEPRDYKDVRKLFATGMDDAMPRVCWDALNIPKLQALLVLVPALLFAMLSMFKVLPVLGAAVAALVALALTLCSVLYFTRTTMKRFIRDSLTTDLADIAGTYLQPGCAFFIAELDGTVVGMVGVQRRTDQEASLRRMAVAPHVRRLGLAKRLAREAVTFASANGYQVVTLMTAAAQVPAIRLYTSLGWKITNTLWDNDIIRLRTMSLWL